MLEKSLSPTINLANHLKFVFMTEYVNDILLESSAEIPDLDPPPPTKKHTQHLDYIPQSLPDNS